MGKTQPWLEGEEFPMKMNVGVGVHLYMHLFVCLILFKGSAVYLRNKLTLVGFITVHLLNEILSFAVEYGMFS